MYKDLIERLKQVETGAPDFIGDTDPDRSRTCWYRNPDGHDAAAAIAQLIERNEVLEMLLAHAHDEVHKYSGIGKPVQHWERELLAKIDIALSATIRNG